MSTRIEILKTALRPVRDRLIAHPIYQQMQSPAALRTFMEFHVYAVWDFMSLLKALQQALTCVGSPWVPRGSANTRYLINEIVVGEESDVDEQGRRTSHFELYLRAMEQAGSGTAPVRGLIEALSQGQPLKDVLDTRVPAGPVRDFLDFTFDTIASGELHTIAAVFTFGREDLIPDMFIKIVQDLSGEVSRERDFSGEESRERGLSGEASEGQGLSAEPARSFDIFTYYLERHIEVDGGHHSHLAMAMLEELCAADDAKWEAAARCAGLALEARIKLWDGVVRAIREKEGLAVMA
jgi:Protein of unknown function (DUF3050)